MTCKNCGSKNPKDAKYCSDCGSLVDEALYTRKKKELAKTILFLVTTLVILFVVIYRIQSDFDNFISYDLPLNLTTEATKEKLIGSWNSNEVSSMIKSAVFKDDEFKFIYQDKKSVSGDYRVADSNTLIVDIVKTDGEDTGNPQDIQYKFHFQGDDTLVIVFNGISNVFERTKTNLE